MHLVKKQNNNKKNVKYHINDFYIGLNKKYY